MVSILYDRTQEFLFLVFLNHAVCTNIPVDLTGIPASKNIYQAIEVLTPKEKLDKIGQPSLVLGLELLIFRSWQAKRATY
jgi:hypothetical protein